MNNSTYANSSPVEFLSSHGRKAEFVPLVCYAGTTTMHYGIWNGENPFTYVFPLFLLQCMLIIATTRTINILLRPLRQPRYISEILGGFVLGPSVMGRITGFSLTAFPLWSLVTLDPIAHIGLVFSTFLVGLEVVEVDSLASGGLRSLAFTVACVLPSLVITSKMGRIVHNLFQEGTHVEAFLAFLGVAVIVSTFSVLARILAEMKLIGSDVGRIVLSCAGLIDVVSWILLTMAVALAQTDSEVEKSLFAVLSAIAFYVLCRIFVRPVVLWVARQATVGEEVNELHMCGMLVGVMAAAVITDSIGMHAIYGAFVLGIMVPNGPFGEAIAEKVGDLVDGLLMPLFLVISGLRTDLSTIKNWDGVAWLVLTVLASAAAKVVASVLMAALCRMPLHDGLSVGLLLNSKGVIELVLLNIARDKHVIEGQTFTILVLMSMMMTAMVGPLLTVVVKPVRRLVSYKRRTIWWTNPDSELRILACVHTPRQAPSLVSLLDVSHPTKRSPIYVYALHLVELTGRAAAMLVVNSAAPTVAAKDPHYQQHLPALGRTQAQSDAINHVFESYEQHAGGVTAQCLSAFSPHATMHEDIIAVAMDRHAAFILLPFHKHKTVDGGMEVVHQAIRSINQAVLAAAPCSVGIFIDRGLGAGEHRKSGYRVALLFFGGVDDREALAFAGRMAGHPKINLKVIRFVYWGGKSRQQQHHHRQGVPAATGGSPKAERVLTVMTDGDRERRLDEDCLVEFQARWGGGMVEYEEVVATNAEETVTAIQRVEESGHDLFVVGRGQNMESPLMEGLNDWSEFPELGPIGDLLASTDFEATASVLVVQRGGGPAIDMLMPDSPGKLGRPFGNKGDQWTRGNRV